MTPPDIVNAKRVKRITHEAEHKNIHLNKVMSSFMFAAYKGFSSTRVRLAPFIVNILEKAGYSLKISDERYDIYIVSWDT